MLDRGKIRTDSLSEKSQGETKERRQHNFLDRAAPSTPSEKSHDGTSPLLRKEIAEKGPVEINKYQKRKEELERAKKALSEAEGKVNQETIEKCELLTLQLKENKKAINQIEDKIYKLYAQEEKITKEDEHSRKNLAEYEETHKKMQAELAAKQKEFANVESKLKEIDIKRAEQEKKRRRLDSYQKGLLAFKDSSPNDDMTSQELVRSLDAVFTSTQFPLKRYPELQELKQIYKEKRELAQEISDLNREVKKLRAEFKLEPPEISPNINFDPTLKRQIDKIEKIKKIIEALPNNDNKNRLSLGRYKLEKQLFTDYYNLTIYCKNKIKTEFEELNWTKEAIKLKLHGIEYKLYFNEKIDNSNRKLFKTSEEDIKKYINGELKEDELIVSICDSMKNIFSYLNSKQQSKLQLRIVAAINSTKDEILKDREGGVFISSKDSILNFYRKYEFTRLGEKVKIDKEIEDLRLQLLECEEQLLPVKTYQYYLQKSLNDCETSQKRNTECDNEVFQKIKGELGNFHSQIKKDLKSSEESLAALNKEYTSQNGIKDKLQYEVSHLKNDILVKKGNIAKQRKDLKEKDKDLKEIQHQISKMKEDLVKTKREGKDTLKELNKLEPEVMLALREVDAATWEWEQAKKEVVDELVKQMRKLVSKLFGNQTIQYCRLGPGNARECSEKRANLEPITYPQTWEVFDLRDREYVKASQSILDRLAKVPRDHSQSFFWKRYASIIEHTIEAYNDPQPEKAQERIKGAMIMLNQANTIANAFLDVMYGKQQEASSSQEQA